MATATSVIITFDDGTTQTVTSVPTATEVISDVEVVNADGTSETFVPETTPEQPAA